MNRLAAETSPYLLQHKDNPVHWWAWGSEAFEEARRTGRPVLLSVGYAACHWCHVMAHESFENPDTAALMNALFVCVKVDREERPDVDQVYMSALHLLGQQGGWPLTMFLTPDGAPFWGGTYFPPESRWGRMGFPDLLRGVAATWRQEPDKVARNVSALADALARQAQARPGGPVGPAVLDEIAGRLLAEVDLEQGGIGRAPKFPQTAVFELLWRAGRRSGPATQDRSAFDEAVVTTLTRMAQGGIYDHLGGGFARYSTDDAWLVPHFEKMLYDNALILDLLTLVWQETRSPLLARRVAETVRWLADEMTADGGCFAASLDADSEGEEGRFYVWTRTEIDAVLGDDAALFCDIYGVTAGGNWEGRTVLNRLAVPQLGGEGLEARLAEARGRLLAHRNGRIRPAWDDKVLADWNGLAIAALANAAAAFEEPAWLDRARRAFDFVLSHMTAPDGRLHHSWRLGRVRHPGSLDDHANMARAALALAEATGDPAYVDAARRWAAVADRHFRDPQAGGYYLTADDTGDLLLRPRHAHDAAVPSGNGTMLGVLARLWLMTGEDAYRTGAEKLVHAFSGELEHNLFPLPTWLNNAELLDAASLLVVAGDPSDPAAAALLAAARVRSRPNLVILPVRPGSALPDGHPAAGKGLVHGRPAAYVCRRMACSLPVTDAAELAALLDTR